MTELQTQRDGITERVTELQTQRDGITQNVTEFQRELQRAWRNYIKRDGIKTISCKNNCHCILMPMDRIRDSRKSQQKMVLKTLNCENRKKSRQIRAKQ